MNQKEKNEQEIKDLELGLDLAIMVIWAVATGVIYWLIPMGETWDGSAMNLLGHILAALLLIGLPLAWIMSKFTPGIKAGILADWALNHQPN